MDDDAPKAEPKIDLTIAIFIGIILVLADLVDLIPLAGDIVDIVIGAPLQLFLFFKGVRGSYILVSNLIELIPLLQEFPTRTIAWIATVVVDRNSKLEAVAELGGGALGGGFGTVEGLAEAGEGVVTAEEFGEALEATEAAEELGAEAEAVENVSEGGEVIENPEEHGESGEAKTPEDIEHEKELEEALGEQRSPSEQLRRELLEQLPEDNPYAGQNDNDEEEDDEPVLHDENRPGVHVPDENPENIETNSVPRPPQASRKVIDIQSKTDILQQRWQDSRRSDSDGPDDTLLPLAA